MFGPANFRQTLLICLVLFACRTATADRFVFQDRDGSTIDVEARLAGEGQGALALELPDGRMKIVPLAAVQSRTAAAPPKPLDANQIAEQLGERFDADRLRTYVQEPFVIGLILERPLDRSEEPRASAFLKTTARFMRNVNTVFLSYAKQLRFPLEPNRFPMVVLVFESDADFEDYATVATGGRGLSAGNIAGFYSALTNDLVLRLTECHTFETPLHEAIHQQVHNRGVLQRLAPIPVWFNEGIATGFEGNAQRINIGPTKISKRYARMARSARQLDWSTIIRDDGAFRGDVLAGEAYAHAWSLHWMLVTEHKVAYMNYVKQLSQLQPLSTVSEQDRTQQFEEAFGDATALQTSFRSALETGLKRQRVDLEERPAVGVSHHQKDMAEVRITAVSRNGVIQVEGGMKNISPFRNRAFHVAVVTDSGRFASWIHPSVRVNQTVPLKRQLVTQVLPGAGGGPSQTFRVYVHSAPEGSREIESWAERPPIDQ